MAVMAVADWAMLYEDSVEVLRGWVRTLFGGTPEENPVEYAAASPIAYAENVSAPVLIIQGRNDSRTPARPIEAYEERLRALGKPVEVEWFDAGHQGAFARAEQAIEHQELMMRSARRMLVGT
jgi:dipeptidyl aminopeptidase/acylaminoacyl peptidase